MVKPGKPDKPQKEFASEIQQFFFKIKDGCNDKELENFRLALKENVEEELVMTIEYPRLAFDEDDGNGPDPFED